MTDQPTNPYASPESVNLQTQPPGSDRVAACPSCGNVYAKRVGFTWWGGVLGPKMFNHVKCTQCRTAYNGKTGKSNDTAIAIYFGVCLAIGAGIGVVVALVAAFG